MAPQRKRDGRGTTPRNDDVDAFLQVLDHPHKEAIQELRRILLSADARIRESIKWNAPSFSIAEHFATFKLRPLTSIQIVLHTGTKVVSPPRPFTIEDPEGLLTWPAPDRAVLTVPSLEAIQVKREAVLAIVRAWIRHLDEPD